MRFIIQETREVAVEAANETEAIRLGKLAFANPGEPAEGMSIGVGGIPKIVRTVIERD